MPNFSPNNATGWLAQDDEFIPPPSGPGPVRSDPAHPYVSFYKFPRNPKPTFRVADLSNPNLTPSAKDSLKKTNEAVLAGKPMWSPSARCRATGPAFFLTPAQPLFIVQTAKQVAMLHQHDNDVRRVYMNVPHSANPKPSWYGESVGRYEGDTLVIDTVGFTDKTFIDNFRTPNSEKLHVVERIRLVEDGKFLQIEAVIEDPAVFLMPLHVTNLTDIDIHYRKLTASGVTPHLDDMVSLIGAANTLVFSSGRWIAHCFQHDCEAEMAHHKVGTQPDD